MAWSCLNFTIATRATGRRRTVKVYVYPTVEEMRQAAHRATGEDYTGALGVCHGWQDDDNPRATLRLTDEHLYSHIVLHELIHAAQWIYCETVPPDDLAVDHYQADNETFAHIVSELWDSLADALARAGRIEEETP